MKPSYLASFLSTALLALIASTATAEPTPLPTATPGLPTNPNQSQTPGPTSSVPNAPSASTPLLPTAIPNPTSSSTQQYRYSGIHYPVFTYINIENNSNFNAQFMTLNPGNELLSSNSWQRLQDPGSMGYLLGSPESGSVPIYRYFNARTADHFYTTNWSELGAGRGGYVFEGFAGYAPTSNSWTNSYYGLIPVKRYYQLYNGRHYYYVDCLGDGNCGVPGLVYEGVAWYAFQN